MERIRSIAFISKGFRVFSTFSDTKLDTKYLFFVNVKFFYQKPTKKFDIYIYNSGVLYLVENQFKRIFELPKTQTMMDIKDISIKVVFIIFIIIG